MPESDGNGFYLQFKVTEESIIQRFTPSLATLFSYWFIEPGISGMDISFPISSVDEKVETGNVMEKAMTALIEDTNDLMERTESFPALDKDDA